jgi:hypothetical protein
MHKRLRVADTRGLLKRLPPLGLQVLRYKTVDRTIEEVSESRIFGGETKCANKSDMAQ